MLLNFVFVFVFVFVHVFLLIYSFIYLSIFKIMNGWFWLEIYGLALYNFLYLCLVLFCFALFFESEMNVFLA